MAIAADPLQGAGFRTPICSGAAAGQIRCRSGEGAICIAIERRCRLRCFRQAGRLTRVKSFAAFFRSLTTVLRHPSTQESGSVPALSSDHEGVSFPIINVLYMRS
jgi:hypothetical protein